MTAVYTDGACIGNPGPGGWAYAVPGGAYRSGAEPQTTNQRMEISAALRAVQDLPDPLVVVADSTYVVNCFEKNWWRAWERNGWQTSARKPVANRDLWEPLVALIRARDVSFRWVKGHSGDVHNDLVDRLATEAARKQAGRSGTGQPPDLGPADDVGAAGPDALVVSPGRRIAVFGHRPPELDGWNRGALSDATEDRLHAIATAQAKLHGGVVLVTGLNLGVEQMAARLGVPFVAVLPFPGQEAKWPAAARREYAGLLERAEDVVTVMAEVPSDTIGFAKAFGARDRRILDLADEAIVVWNGQSGPVSRQLDDARKRLREENVWVVNLGEFAAGPAPKQEWPR